MTKLWKRVDITKHANGCWSYRRRNLQHYAQVYSPDEKNSYVYLHRRSLEHALKRRLGRTEFACHTCDNPGCFNPAHLFVGSSKDNMADCRNKRRHAHGETSYSKLTARQVLLIRQEFIPGVTLIKAVSKKYRVSDQTINKVLRGKTWAHISGKRIHGSLIRRGEASVVSRLRHFQVYRARRLKFGLNLSVASIARILGVNHHTLYDAIYKRKTWK